MPVSYTHLDVYKRQLEGRAAGVSVQNVSGTFGTAPKIRVRGATSIYGRDVYKRQTLLHVFSQSVRSFLLKRF